MNLLSPLLKKGLAVLLSLGLIVLSSSLSQALDGSAQRQLSSHSLINGHIRLDQEALNVSDCWFLKLVASRQSRSFIFRKTYQRVPIQKGPIATPPLSIAGAPASLFGLIAASCKASPAWVQFWGYFGLGFEIVAGITAWYLAPDAQWTFILANSIALLHIPFFMYLSRRGPGGALHLRHYLGSFLIFNAYAVAVLVAQVSIPLSLFVLTTTVLAHLFLDDEQISRITNEYISLPFIQPLTGFQRIFSALFLRGNEIKFADDELRNHPERNPLLSRHFRNAAFYSFVMETEIGNERPRIHGMISPDGQQIIFDNNLVREIRSKVRSNEFFEFTIAATFGNNANFEKLELVGSPDSKPLPASLARYLTRMVSEANSTKATVVYLDGKKVKPDPQGRIHLHFGKLQEGVSLNHYLSLPHLIVDAIERTAYLWTPEGPESKLELVARAANHGTKYSIGRSGLGNDLVIRREWVSRSHATIVATAHNLKIKSIKPENPLSELSPPVGGQWAQSLAHPSTIWFGNLWADIRLWTYPKFLKWLPATFSMRLRLFGQYLKLPGIVGQRGTPLREKWIREEFAMGFEQLFFLLFPKLFEMLHGDIKPQYLDAMTDTERAEARAVAQKWRDVRRQAAIHLGDIARNRFNGLLQENLDRISQGTKPFVAWVFEETTPFWIRVLLHWSAALQGARATQDPHRLHNQKYGNTPAVLMWGFHAESSAA
jgi:hypothetical protein